MTEHTYLLQIINLNTKTKNIQIKKDATVIVTILINKETRNNNAKKS